MRSPLVNLILFALAGFAGVIAWQKTRKAQSVKRAQTAAVDRVLSKVEEELREAAVDNVTESLPAMAYADVNGDGKKELLIQYSSGAHGSSLRIFVWRDQEFEELAHLHSGTPTGFEFGDFDGDGRIEIKKEETDWSVGLPYVSAPRYVMLIRWDGTDFAEVSRK